jgi:glycosyltransferase involved in cell wall biosynthesis
MDESEPIEISVVVPTYNEEENLLILIPMLTGILGSLRKPYEMVFVDDGSMDRSRMKGRGIRHEIDGRA